MPYGQNFQRLPGSEPPKPTAAGMLNTQFRQRATELQTSFKQQWDSIARKSKKLGLDKARAILQNLTTQAQKNAQALQSNFNKQAEYLSSIDQLQAAGLISNGDELKWKALMGRDVSESMYPDAPKQKTTMQQLRPITRSL